MRIVIDARMLFWTGVGRYTQALLTELEAVDHDNQYVVLVRRADWAKWQPAQANFSKVESNINPYSLAEQWKLWRQLRALRPDLVHFTAPNAPLLYRGRRLVTIHDLTLLDFDTSRGQGMAKVMRGLKRIPFRLVMTNDARSATTILTATDYVHDQVIDRLGAPSARVRTVLLAADPSVAKPEPLTRFGNLGMYAFYIGNMYPYKNLGSTIEAMAKLNDRLPQLNLVIAGKPDSFTDELKAKAQSLRVLDRVKFLGFVSDGEMISLYRGAAVYVNPSLSEGFGLQGLEAMAQGLPVVAARASCLPEVYDEAAEYFDPRDPADQARAIGRVVSDPAVAGRLRAAGTQRLKDFSWRRMAEQTLEAYRSAAKV
jgi:glycosyltransferase involved in cell wall biosynthesis